MTKCLKRHAQISEWLECPDCKPSVLSDLLYCQVYRRSAGVTDYLNSNLKEAYMPKNNIRAIHIGADVEQSKKVLPDVTRAILQIMNSPAGDEVKKKALEMLSGTFEVKNCFVTNCNFEVIGGVV